MSTEHIYKSHNTSLLMYQLVCPVTYRRAVFTEEVEETLKKLCIGIEERYEIHFIDIEADENHIHFLIQSVPSLSPTYIVNMIQGITAREIFKLHPRIKKEVLWGGHFWTSGLYINTVGTFANEEMMKNYIKHQGIPKQHQKEYKKTYYNSNQLNLFTIE